MDEKYKARCLKRLKEWDAPLNGWECIGVIDMSEENEGPGAVCDLCGCMRIRFVHVMHHPKYFEDLYTGCICAGLMEGDELSASERERKMRNRAKRRKNFLKHEWKKRCYGWYRSYRKQSLKIVKTDKGYVVYADGKYAGKYKGKAITDFLSALYAVFDLADPTGKAQE